MQRALLIVLFHAILFGSQVLAATHIPFCKAASISLNLTMNQGNMSYKDSLISSIDVTPQMIENLEVLGKLWGFIKYYHPAVASGKYNWDEELLKILPDVLGSRNRAARNEILVQWVDRLGDVETGNYPVIDSAIIKIKPDYGWIESNQMSEKLTEKLNRIKFAKRETVHHYVAFDSFPNPTFLHEEPYQNMPYPDAGYRILSLFRYWNIVQYFFPYKYLIDGNWQDVLQEFIPRFIGAGNQLEYELTVLSLIARIKDAHAGMSSSQVIETFRGNYLVPVEITFVEGKAVISGFLDLIFSRQTKLRKGDIIERVNHKSVQSIIQERAPYISAANTHTLLREIAWHLLRSQKPEIHIQYRRKNRKNAMQVSCLPFQDVNIYQRIQKEDTCFRMLSPDVAYMNPWTIKSRYIPEIMKTAAHTKGLIIDLRYPIRESLYELGNFILDKPHTFALWTRGNLHFPGLFTFWRKEEIGKNNPAPYQGKIIILNNEYSQSASEFMTMALRSTPHATVVGSTTTGTDGTVSFFPLPGGIPTLITGGGIYYPDGKETQGVGLIPDVEIRPTIKGIAEGRDELLEKAIELISK